MTLIEFGYQMARLSLIFNPGMFDGDSGTRLRDEYFRAIGEQINVIDLNTAVNGLIREHEGYFPKPAKIIEYTQRAARERIEQERSRRLQLPEPEMTEEQKEKTKETFEDFYVKFAKKIN